LKWSCQRAEEWKDWTLEAELSGEDVAAVAAPPVKAESIAPIALRW